MLESAEGRKATPRRPARYGSLPVIELLILAAELILGMALGFIGSRREGVWLPIMITFGSVVCAGIVLYAASSYTCPAGAECETTWANWTWVGIALVGFWLLAVAMGYALSWRFR